MNIQTVYFLLLIFCGALGLRLLRSKSALGGNPDVEVEAARAHHQNNTQLRTSVRT